MRERRGAFAGALLLVGTSFAASGCNPAFGLEQTQLVDAPPPDFDLDGVGDDRDNCLTVANHDQIDADKDGFGDACDGCPALATQVNHDEDGDLHGDDCDVCPTVPDFQDDTDHNGIGDACPPSPITPKARLLFDPFVQLDTTRWVSEKSPWVTKADAIAPADVLPIDDQGLALAGVTFPGTEWRVQIGFRTARTWKDGDRFGIRVVNAADESPYFSCFVECKSGDCIQTLTSTTTESPIPQQPAPVTSLLVEVHHDPQGDIDIAYCGHDAFVAAVSTPITPDAKVYIYAMPDIVASFADVLK